MKYVFKIITLVVFVCNLGVAFAQETQVEVKEQSDLVVSDQKKDGGAEIEVQKLVISDTVLSTVDKKNCEEGCKKACCASKKSNEGGATQKKACKADCKKACCATTTQKKKSCCKGKKSCKKKDGVS